MNITADNLKGLLQLPSNCGLSSAHPAKEDPQHWSLGPCIRTRDSTLLESSNADVLLRELKKSSVPEDQWEVHSLGHWAVGWVEHLSFRVFTEAMTPTECALFLIEWGEKLDRYPIADEDDYNDKETDATLDNIREAGRRFVKKGVPEDWPDAVYSWFADHNDRAIENRDDQGGYPNDDEIRAALDALGFLDKEDE